MTTFNIIDDDITKATEGLIIHQVNVHGSMGGGVARALADKFPNLEPAYEEFCADEEYDYRNLRGKVQFVAVAPNLMVANLFTQHDEFKRGILTDYSAYPLALQELYPHVSLSTPIHVPYLMGSGIARGNWPVVKGYLTRFLSPFKKVTYWRYQPPSFTVSPKLLTTKQEALAEKK